MKRIDLLHEASQVSEPDMEATKKKILRDLILEAIAQAGIDGLDESQLFLALRNHSAVLMSDTPIEVSEAFLAIHALVAAGLIQPAGRTGYRLSTREWAKQLAYEVPTKYDEDPGTLVSRFERILAGRSR